jgi:hypothetical protein
VITDTRFTNSEVDELLTEYGNIYAAASSGWTIKAGLLQSQIGKLFCRSGKV